MLRVMNIALTCNFLNFLTHNIATHRVFMRLKTCLCFRSVEAHLTRKGTCSCSLPHIHLRFFAKLKISTCKELPVHSSNAKRVNDKSGVVKDLLYLMIPEILASFVLAVLSPWSAFSLDSLINLPFSWFCSEVIPQTHFTPPSEHSPNQTASIC